MVKSPKIFRMSHHQNKENAFSEALRFRGWHESRYVRSRDVRFGLFDADWRPADIEALNGAPYFLYPHAARPMVQYDGCVKPRSDCRAMFVSADAGLYLMEKIGYPCEVVKVGWTLTKIRPFQPKAEAKKIVFAPIHPNANGWLSEVDKDLNRKTYATLTKYAEETGASILVRFCRRIEDNGLGAEIEAGHPNVIWKQASPDGSTHDITTADLVVAHQTFAYMAVALGVPTVMMGEDIPPRSGNSDAGFCFSEHFDDYKDYLMFPLDILNGDPAEIISRAISTGEDIADWRSRFIGEPFNAEFFVKSIEERL